MVAVLHKVVEEVASRGNSVIVGRGAPYILRNRRDAFHAFIYAPVEEKIRRIIDRSENPKKKRRSSWKRSMRNALRSSGTISTKNGRCESFTI